MFKSTHPNDPDLKRNSKKKNGKMVRVEVFDVYIDSIETNLFGRSIFVSISSPTQVVETKDVLYRNDPSWNQNFSVELGEKLVCSLLIRPEKDSEEVVVIGRSSINSNVIENYIKNAPTKCCVLLKKENKSIGHLNIQITPLNFGIEMNTLSQEKAKELKIKVYKYVLKNQAKSLKQAMSYVDDTDSCLGEILNQEIEKDKYSPLFYCVVNGYFAIVEILLSYARHIELDKYFGPTTSLQYCLINLIEFEKEKMKKFPSRNIDFLMQKYETISKMLIQCGSNVNLQTKFTDERDYFNEYSMLMNMIRARVSDKLIKRIFFNSKIRYYEPVNLKFVHKKKFETSLHLACKYELYETFEIILSKEKKIESKPDIYGKTRFIRLERVKNYHDEDILLLSAKHNKTPKLFRYILQKGLCYINSRDRDGNTSAHICCQKNKTDFIQILMQHKGDFSVKNKKGQTPSDLLPQNMPNEYKTTVREFNNEMFEYIDLFDFKKDMSIINKGKGTSCEIYKCRIGSKLFAVKNYSSVNINKRDLERMIKTEVSVLYKMRDCDDIIKVHYFCPAADCRGIVMELCDYNLKDKVILSLPLVEKLEILKQLTNGLNSLLKRFIIHSDVKPENILILREKGKYKVRIIDFGTSVIKNEEFTSLKIDDEYSLFISSHYTAPEKLKKNGREVTGGGDVFSFGVCAYELLHQKLDAFEDVIERKGLNEKDYTTKKLQFILQTESLNLFQKRKVNKEFEPLFHCLNGCLSKDPMKRPTFDIIMNVIEKSIIFAKKGKKLFVDFEKHSKHGGSRLCLCKMCLKEFCDMCGNFFVCENCDFQYCENCLKKILDENVNVYDCEKFCLKCIKKYILKK